MCTVHIVVMWFPSYLTIDFFSNDVNMLDQPAYLTQSMATGNPVRVSHMTYAGPLHPPKIQLQQLQLC